MSFLGSHAKATLSQSKAAKAEKSDIVNRDNAKGKQDSQDIGDDFGISEGEEGDGDDDNDDDDDDDLYDTSNTNVGSTPATTTQLPPHSTSSSVTPPPRFSSSRHTPSSDFLHLNPSSSSGPFAVKLANDAATVDSAASGPPSSTEKKKKRRLDEVASAAGVFLSPASSSTHSKISCSECRASKTRCSGGDVCERCQRLQRECVYKEHRRGHFSDNPRIQHLEQTISTLLAQIRTLQAVPASTATPSTFSLLQVSSTTPSASTAIRSPSLRSDVHRQSPSRSASSSASLYDVQMSPSFGEQQPIRDAAAHFSRLLSSPLELLTYSQSQIQRDANATITQSTMFDDNQAQLSAATYAVLLPSVSESNYDLFCPIDKRILTTAKAEALLNAFMNHINPQVTLLDVNLHTIAYIRSHSSFLLTAVCYVASLFDAESASVSRDLEQYLQHAVLPAILTTHGGYRSVEIVQAFVLLAHYYPATDRTSDDRAWHFVGHAARIGAELGLNHIIQLSAQQPIDEGLVRRTRNRQRAWLGVWMCEMVLCEQLGRVPLLRVDPLIVSSGTGAGWQGDTPFALASDGETVSRMQMHMIVLRQMELYERVLVSTSPHLTPATATVSIQNTVYQAYESATKQLDAWLATWMHVPSGTAAEGSLLASTMLPLQVMQRQARARLTYWYVKNLLAMRAVQFFSLQQAASNRESATTMKALYRDAFHSCLAYLNQYVGLYEGTAGTPVTSTPADTLTAVIMYGSNVTVVAPTYCSMVGLHILTRASTLLAAEERINAQEVFALMLRAADTMMVLSAVAAQRGSAGERYGPLLRAAVGQARTDVKRKGGLPTTTAAAAAAKTGRRRKDTSRSDARGSSVQKQQRVAEGTSLRGTLPSSKVLVPLHSANVDTGGMGMARGSSSGSDMMDVTMSSMLPPSYPLYGNSGLTLPPPPPAPLSTSELPSMMAGPSNPAGLPQPPWDSLAMHYPWPPMYVPQASQQQQQQQGGQQAQSPLQPPMMPHQPMMGNTADESLHHLLFSSSFYSPSQQHPPSSSAPPRRQPTPPAGS